MNCDITCIQNIVFTDILLSVVQFTFWAIYKNVWINTTGSAFMAVKLLLLLKQTFTNNFYCFVISNTDTRVWEVSAIIPLSLSWWKVILFFHFIIEGASLLAWKWCKEWTWVDFFAANSMHFSTNWNCSPNQHKGLNSFSKKNFFPKPEILLAKDREKSWCHHFLVSFSLVVRALMPNPDSVPPSTWDGERIWTWGSLNAKKCPSHWAMEYSDVALAQSLLLKQFYNV